MERNIKLFLMASLGIICGTRNVQASMDDILPSDQPIGSAHAENQSRSYTLHSAVYLEYRSGQLAGMDNVILQPKGALGVTEQLKLASLPDWSNMLNLYALYGSAQTGTGTTGQQLQEGRGQWQSLYTFYSHDNVLKFKAGLYSEFAFPFHSQQPYVDPSTTDPYSQEENEKLTSEKLFGADFNIDFAYDRLQSSFHNLLFFSGSRIGPNLLAYSPLLAIDWTNRAYLIGSAEHEKLDFYTNVQFWFARKGNSASLFNSHDGLGGTKREIDIILGLEYHATPALQLYIENYGDNNLNRGGSTSVPQDFRDGMISGIRYEF